MLKQIVCDMEKVRRNRSDFFYENGDLKTEGFLSLYWALSHYTLSNFDIGKIANKTFMNPLDFSEDYSSDDALCTKKHAFRDINHYNFLKALMYIKGTPFYVEEISNVGVDTWIFMCLELFKERDL